MRPTSKPPDEGGRARPARPLRLLVGRAPTRLEALRLVTAAALLAGLLLSPNLWFPSARTFPRAPLLPAPPPHLVAALEYILGFLLVAALVALLSGWKARAASAAVVGLLSLYVLLDQTRLQPWVYQYLLLFVIMASHGRRGAGGGESAEAPLAAARLTVAALYFWGGAQKLNHSFGREVLPQLLAPLRDDLGLLGTHLPALGVAAALCEMFAGAGLLFGRTRKLCVWLALAMHALILGLLLAQGRNSVVWAWNAALLLMVPALFWGSDASIWRGLSGRPGADGAGRAARAVAVACSLLPLASFWGWWDMYLSGALYSGNTAAAAVRVEGDIYERLPESARRMVFTAGGGERVLPVFEWAMADLNVPPYPEPRVFRQVARATCRLAGGGRGRAELIVRGRPSALDGRYAVTRLDCAQLGE